MSNSDAPAPRGGPQDFLRRIHWQGVARLDCYFDENERKYYITPQSIERAIAEEKAKAEKAQHGIA